MARELGIVCVCFYCGGPWEPPGSGSVGVHSPAATNSNNPRPHSRALPRSFLYIAQLLSFSPLPATMASSSSSSPELCAAAAASSSHQFASVQYSDLSQGEVLEDLSRFVSPHLLIIPGSHHAYSSSRFILNLPEEELASVERVCFQVEQALVVSLPQHLHSVDYL